MRTSDLEYFGATWRRYKNNKFLYRHILFDFS